MALAKKEIILVIIIFLTFIIDRVSKIFIIDFFLQDNLKEFYITPFLNLVLSWNSGIAFGLFGDKNEFVYNLFSALIFLIIIFIIFLMILEKSYKDKLCFSLILGGAIGNFFDRIYYGSVPDFIDIHYNQFHWFIFNFADIFISIGIILLIIFMLFNNKKNENL